MKFKIATALIAATGALSLTGSASAWWFYVPPTTQQEQKSNPEKKLEQVHQSLASNIRG